MRTSSNQFHIKKYYLSAQFNQNFALSKTLSLILFGTYRFNQIWSNSLYEPNGRLDISFKKKLLEGKLVMSLGLDDLLNCYGKSQSSQFFNQDKLMINRTFQSREINLSIIYRFEIGQRFKQHSIERGNTVEQGRL